MGRTECLILLDSTLFLVVIAVRTLPLTGLPAHEWLGLAVSPLMIAHIVFQWNWLSCALRRLATRGTWRLRINLLINAALFTAGVLAIYSGIMISQVVLPAVDVAAGANPAWILIHGLSQRLFVGLHLAINWRCTTGVVSRGVFGS